MTSQELLTQVDDSDKVIGLRPRSQFETGDFIHRSSYLLVLDSGGRLLLQQKALSKKWNPGKWTFPVAGTVADESYEDCIRRELKEAFGRIIKFKRLLKYKYFETGDKAFKTVYLGHAKTRDLVLNNEYAGAWRWIKPQLLKAEIDNQPEKFAPPFIAAMDIIFDKKLLEDGQ